MFRKRCELDGQNQHEFFHGVLAALKTDGINFINGSDCLHPSHNQYYPVLYLSHAKDVSIANAVFEGNSKTIAPYLLPIFFVADGDLKLHNVEFKHNKAVCITILGLISHLALCPLTFLCPLFMHSTALKNIDTTKQTLKDGMVQVRDLSSFSMTKSLFSGNEG
jgi:hypothetical protein